MPEILVLQHIHCETLGIIEQVLVRFGLTPRCLEVFAGEPEPRRMGQAAGLVFARLTPRDASLPAESGRPRLSPFAW